MVFYDAIHIVFLVLWGSEGVYNVRIIVGYTLGHLRLQGPACLVGVSVQSTPDISWLLISLQFSFEV